jgi:hypothetical protein
MSINPTNLRAIVPALNFVPAFTDDQITMLRLLVNNLILRCSIHSYLATGDN